MRGVILEGDESIPTNRHNYHNEKNKEGGGSSSFDLNLVCERLVSAALTRGSADNVSVVVVMFGQSSKSHLTGRAQSSSQI